MQYASFWKRLGAMLIDGIGLLIVVGIPLWILNMVLGGLMGNMGKALGGLIDLVVRTVVYWLYFAYMESSEYQATLGKKLLGLQVTDLEGNRISFARATGRYFAKILSAIIFLVGYFMAAFTERKQGLHDILAKTLVLDKSA